MQHKQSASNLRIRIFSPLIIVVLLIALMMQLVIYNVAQTIVLNNMNDNIEQVQKSLDHSVEELNRKLKRLISIVISRQDFIQAMQQKNREHLFQLSKPLLDHWYELLHVSHFYFHTPDGVNLLRVHLPDNYGDAIDRHSMLVAFHTGKVGIATETGLTGEWVHRVVMPWEFNNKIIGYVELGVDMERIYADVGTYFTSGMLVLLNKTYITSPRMWERRRHELKLSPYSWDTLPNYVVVAQTGIQLDAEQLKMLDFLHQKNSVFEAGNQSLLMNIRELYQEQTGSVIGVSVQFIDISEIREATYHNAIIAIAAILGTLVVAAISLYGYLGKIQWQLETEEERMQAKLNASQTELLALNHTLKSRLAAEAERADIFHHDAFHDPLTGLANRALLLERLKHELIVAQRQSSRRGIMFIDLDHFKQVNDTFGHDVGDKLLKIVAEYLRRCVRKSDTLARFGGDEFVILLGHTDACENYSRVAKLIVRYLSRPIDIADCTVNIGASVGIACYPENASSTEELIKLADDAMYKAKSSGRSTFCFSSQLIAPLSRNNYN